MAARVAAALGADARVSRIQVSGGAVSLYVPMELPAGLVERLRRVRGVQEVRVVVSAT